MAEKEAFRPPFKYLRRNHSVCETRYTRFQSDTERITIVETTLNKSCSRNAEIQGNDLLFVGTERDPFCNRRDRASQSINREDVEPILKAVRGGTSKSFNRNEALMPVVDNASAKLRA